MALPQTVSWLELAWTIVALHGFALWAWNARGAYRSLRAVKTLKMRNGRMLWARFALQLCSAFAIVELTFLVVGSIAMTRVSNPASAGALASGTASTITGLALLGSSLVLTATASRWRRVDAALVARSRARVEE